MESCLGKIINPEQVSDICCCYSGLHLNCFNNRTGSSEEDEYIKSCATDDPSESNCSIQDFGAYQWTDMWNEQNEFGYYSPLEINSLKKKPSRFPLYRELPWFKCYGQGKIAEHDIDPKLSPSWSSKPSCNLQSYGLCSIVNSCGSTNTNQDGSQVLAHGEPDMDFNADLVGETEWEEIDLETNIKVEMRQKHITWITRK